MLSHHAASGITLNSEKTENVPPSKTDKPRPYACAICYRAFSRLEHLKRHERSHTKEKPYECPECARCFARGDLLLRHQQKLHWTTTPSSRARNLRESATSLTSGQCRARNNSVAGTATGPNSAAASMWPGANTIARVDGAALQTTESARASIARDMAAQSCHSSLADFPFLSDPVFGGGMPAALDQVGMQHGLPKLDIMQTVPPLPALSPGFDFGGIFFTSTSAINPSSLQYYDSPQTMVMDQWSPF